MNRPVKNLLNCAIIFILATSSLSGCASKNSEDKVLFEADRKVIETTYNYVDCGDLKLKNIGIEMEDPKKHAGSYENQQILTRNLIILDYKLKEAETILECYKRQVKKEKEK